MTIVLLKSQIPKELEAVLHNEILREGGTF